MQFNYRRIFRDFLRNSYINGLHPLLLETPMRHAKALWLTLLAVIIVSTHIVIANLLHEYIVQPTEVHIAPYNVHVGNSPFPAVAVCSANKMSKSLLQNYAMKVFEHQKLNASNAIRESPQAPRNVDDLARRLLLLGNFYLAANEEPTIDGEVLAHLHALLSSYYNTSDYSVRDILRDLAPECQQLVLRGIIFGQPANTSQLFLKRPSSASVCCIFNYRRPSYSRNLTLRAMDDKMTDAAPKVKFESNSILNSVQFVLQDVSDDEYTWSYYNNKALQVLVFPQEDYAAVQSNNLGEILVEYNTIVEIPIQPKFFGATSIVHAVPADKRRCYYPEEGKKVLNQSYYSLDECLLSCRMDSMLEHCGCVSSPMAASALDVTTCTLPDLPCLLNWKRIWYDYQPFPYVQYDDGRDAQSVKQCGYCLPTCNGANFRIYTNVAPLRKAYADTGYSHGLLKGLGNDRPLAVIKLFFKQRYSQATETSLVSDWVTLLNRFGGILSLMYGFSIISYIEILYYLTGKWFVYFYRACTGSEKQSDDVAKLPKRELYWKELMPKGVHLPKLK